MLYVCFFFSSCPNSECRHIKCEKRTVWVWYHQPLFVKVCSATSSLNMHSQTRAHTSTLHCKWLMRNATVSLSKRADPCPLQQTQTRAVGEPSHCVWRSFTRASRYTSTTYHQPLGCRGSRDAGAALFCSRPCSLTLLPQRPLCGFLRNIRQTASVTRRRDGLLLQVHFIVCAYASSGSSFSLPECTPGPLIQTLDSIFGQRLGSV